MVTRAGFREWLTNEWEWSGVKPFWQDQAVVGANQVLTETYGLSVEYLFLFLNPQPHEKWHKKLLQFKVTVSRDF